MALWNVIAACPFSRIFGMRALKKSHTVPYSRGRGGGHYEFYCLFLLISFSHFKIYIILSTSPRAVQYVELTLLFKGGSVMIWSWWG